MNELLAMIISLLVYPGLIFALVAALIFGWLRGVARATAQGWSIGMPIFAPREVLRRLRQGSTVPEGVFAPLMQVLPVLANICPLLVLVFLPLPANRGADNGTYTADVVALAALLLGVPVIRIVLGWATPSPYTRLAATRSVRQLMGYLVPFALAVAVAAAVGNSLKVYTIATHQSASFTTQSVLGFNAARLYGLTRIIAGLAYLACLPTLAKLTPIREGQGGLDLVGNELTEMSGRELLVMRIGEWIQLVAALGLGIVLFVLPFFSTDGARAIAALVAAVVAAVLLGVWEGAGTYLRPARDELEAPLTIWFGTPTFLGIISLLILVLAQRYSV
jgi:NADH:ubiquinone oxidoreductase subunit H